jgi:hypothetical protein
MKIGVLPCTILIIALMTFWASAAGIGPPLAQSSNSTVWTMGSPVALPIWAMQPILPVAMSCGHDEAGLGEQRLRLARCLVQRARPAAACRN